MKPARKSFLVFENSQVGIGLLGRVDTGEWIIIIIAMSEVHTIPLLVLYLLGCLNSYGIRTGGFPEPLAAARGPGNVPSAIFFAVCAGQSPEAFRHIQLFSGNQRSDPPPGMRLRRSVLYLSASEPGSQGVPESQKT